MIITAKTQNIELFKKIEEHYRYLHNIYYTVFRKKETDSELKESKYSKTAMLAPFTNLLGDKRLYIGISRRIREGRGYVKPPLHLLTFRLSHIKVIDNHFIFAGEIFWLPKEYQVPENKIVVINDAIVRIQKNGTITIQVDDEGMTIAKRWKCHKHYTNGWDYEEEFISEEELSKNPKQLPLDPQLPGYPDSMKVQLLRLHVI